MYVRLPTIIRASAWSACGLVLAQIAIYRTAGVGQDPLQFFHPPSEYASILLEAPTALRAVITLDDLFIVAFTVMFFALFARLLELGAARFLVIAALSCTSLLGVLDMVVVLANQASLDPVATAGDLAAAQEPAVPRDGNRPHLIAQRFERGGAHRSEIPQELGQRLEGGSIHTASVQGRRRWPV